MFKWLFKKNKSSGKNSLNTEGSDSFDQTLSDIVRGIAHAAQSANEISELAILKHFNHFFEEENSCLIAKTAKIQIDEKHVFNIPLITLVDPSTLSLNEIEVKMAVRMQESTVKEQLHLVSDELKVQRTSFNVSLTGCRPDKQDTIKVTMKFAKAEPQEGLSRMLELLNNTIKPELDSQSSDSENS